MLASIPVQTSTSTSGSQNLPPKIFPFTFRTEDLLPYSSWQLTIVVILVLAATIGPLGNVFSIAALVTAWKADLANSGVLPEGADELGTPVPDQKWQVALKAASLACGCFGSFFLLTVMFRRVGYSIGLPMSVIFWFLATGILVADLIAMHVYAPPVGPGQTYSQGFWYAVLACILYWINAVLLMIHMWGYFLGHYPQITLSEERGRVLIIKTTLFFFWMAAGAGVFSKLCGFSYADALYFCNGTLLAIGYGNFAPPSDAGRGVVVPYTVIGIIILGLMINSLLEFAKALKDHLFLNWKKKFLASPQQKKISKLREEKERFDAMKETHANAMKFSQYYALIMDVLAFSILLFVGALVFMLAERREQDVSYSAALYFSYVSLPAIGYGGLVLESNVGKPFFIIWSLFIIPTLAILIADTINVITAALNRRAITIVKRTALPREDAWHEQLATDDCPSDYDLAQKLSIAIKNCANDLYNDPSKEYCYEEWVEFAHLLRFSAKRGGERGIVERVHLSPFRAKRRGEIERGEEKGTVERVHLSPFRAKRREEIERGEEKGIVKGDWTGPDNPFLEDIPQAKWILDELLKSLDRYLKQARRVGRS